MVDELRAELTGAMASVRAGGPVPWGGQPLPARDDVVMLAMEEGRKALEEQWRAGAIGDESVRQEYWKELLAAIADEEKTLNALNIQLAEGKLRKAGSDWECWINQEGDASASDERSEALMEVVDSGVPMKAAVRAVRAALNATRMARIRWDGSMGAVRGELQLLSEELAAKAQAAEKAEKAISKRDAQAQERIKNLDKSREQVKTLQEQVREAIQKEKALREQAFTAQEESRKEQRAKQETAKRARDLQWEVSERENKIAELKKKKEDEEEEEDDDGEEEASKKKHFTKPRCGCNVM